MTAKPALPFEIVDGSISRRDAAERLVLPGQLERLLGIQMLRTWYPVQHAAAAVGLGRLVHESARFVGNELRQAPGLRGYTLRDGHRAVLLRHGRIDVWTFNEIFHLKLYEPPPPVAVLLERVERPLILDLGANIGLFGLHALQRYPGSQVIGYEPDPESAALHRHLLARNPADASRWRLIEAAAGPHHGSVTFLPGQETESRIVDGSAPGSVNVPMEDVLPVFAEADLVKLDIEGGEWALLADPRFGTARAVVLEYHPPGSPEPDTHQAARRLLAGHGYEVVPLFEHPGGVGMAWAYRRDSL